MNPRADGNKNHCICWYGGAAAFHVKCHIIQLCKLIQLRYEMKFDNQIVLLPNQQHDEQDKKEEEEEEDGEKKHAAENATWDQSNK